MKTAKILKGSFSPTAGSKVRRIYDAYRNPVGTITKNDDGGYTVYRFKDGKIKRKNTLEDAFKAMARQN